MKWHFVTWPEESKGPGPLPSLTLFYPHWAWLYKFLPISEPSPVLYPLPENVFLVPFYLAFSPLLTCHVQISQFDTGPLTPFLHGPIISVVALALCAFCLLYLCPTDHKPHEGQGPFRGVPCCILPPNAWLLGMTNDSFMKRDWTASVVFISLGSLPSENLMVAIVPSLEPDICTRKPRLISGQDFDHRW